MKAAALGLAALAIGIQTLRWIIAKTDIESEDDGFDPAPESPAKEKVICDPYLSINLACPSSAQNVCLSALHANAAKPSKS